MKITTKTVHCVDYHDLETAIRKEFKFKEYSYIELEEASNDTSKIYKIKNEPASKIDVTDLEEMITAKEPEPFRTRMLMEEMCRRGKIPEGEYLVKVSW